MFNPFTAAGRLGFEFRVAVRFLREGRFQTVLIIFGVAAGVAVVAYISALIDGLQRNTLEKTLGAQAHISVQPRDERVIAPPRSASGPLVATDVQPRAQRLRSIANWQAVAEALERTPGIAAVSPMVSGPALAQRAEATRSVAVTGVEIERYDRIVKLREKLVAGPLRLQPGEAIVGTTLAEDLGLRLGDRLALTTGARQSMLRVSALVDLGIRDLNRRTVIVPLREAQSLLDLAGGATHLEMSVHDVWAAQDVAAQLARQLPYRVESWQQSNAQLVSALNAQTISTTLIRGVVVIVVVLGIASVLVVSVVQKQREIGILRAMGATRTQVMRILLVQGTLVGAGGSVAGLALAMLMIFVFTHFVRGSDGLPLFSISLPPGVALRTGLIALAAGVLAAIAPARRAARMDPAQAIRL